MGRRLDTGALKNMVKMANQSLYDDESDPQDITEDGAEGGYFDEYNYDEYNDRKFRRGTRKGDML